MSDYQEIFDILVKIDTSSEVLDIRGASGLTFDENFVVISQSVEGLLKNYIMPTTSVLYMVTTAKAKASKAPKGGSVVRFPKGKLSAQKESNPQDTGESA